jgi:hypothetical protein
MEILRKGIMVMEAIEIQFIEIEKKIMWGKVHDQK